MSLPPAAIAAAFVAACRAELLALKPGNVHVHAAGHGMTVQDFERSAESAAPEIAASGRSVGERILAAVAATRAAVGVSSLVTHAKTDLYLHTAAWEGGPLAPLEAAAAGCPVLSRTIGSMSSLGYRVVGNTPAQAATAVNEFFSSDDFRKQAENSTAAVLRYHSLANMSEALKEAYRIDTTNPETLVLLTDVYAHKNMWDESLKTARAMLLQNVDQSGLVRRGDIYMRLAAAHVGLKEPQKAMSMLKRGLEEDPQHPEIPARITALQSGG